MVMMKYTLNHIYANWLLLKDFFKLAMVGTNDRQHLFCSGKKPQLLVLL